MWIGGIDSSYIDIMANKQINYETITNGNLELNGENNEEPCSQ